MRRFLKAADGAWARVTPETAETAIRRRDGLGFAPVLFAPTRSGPREQTRPFCSHNAEQGAAVRRYRHVYRGNSFFSAKMSECGGDATYFAPSDRAPARWGLAGSARMDQRGVLLAWRDRRRRGGDIRDDPGDQPWNLHWHHWQGRPALLRRRRLLGDRLSRKRRNIRIPDART